MHHSRPFVRDPQMSHEIDAEQEREWIAGLHSGRLDTFRDLFQAYEARLYYFACLWVSHDVAQDIVQDVFFDVWQRRAQLRIVPGRLGPYLFSAVRNHVRNHARHDKIVNRAAQDILSDTPPGMGRMSNEADAQILAADLDFRIAEAMASLSETQRAVLMLRWVHDMSFADIASSLSISENAARLHGSRGRQALSEILRPVLDD